MSVELTCGRVRGRDASTYLGVPYGTAQRWAPPGPVSWQGELDAVEFGPPPPQPVRPISAFAWGPIPPGDEECLRLNVWTPRTGSGPWPVFVFVIGGGFTVGWTGSGLDDGARLAEVAQAVVVTFSYRLGSLGWAFGNWGMHDQLAVLEWVQREIGAFGGDPARVTLGGQSAGAASVAGLLVSPAARGLFAQAILHSPPLPEAGNDPARRARWDADVAAALGAAIAAEAAAGGAALGAAALPAALREAPAAAVVAAHERLLARGEWRGTRGGALPTLGDLLPVAPLDAPDASLDVPVLVGTTRDEATFVLRTGGREASDEQVRALTAHLFHEPVERWAGAHRAAGGRVHRFRVDHASPDPSLGALHTIDVALLFGNDNPVSRHYTDPAPEVTAVMQREWGRFLHGEDIGPELVIG